jgi:hypothetical protein
MPQLVKFACRDPDSVEGELIKARAEFGGTAVRAAARANERANGWFAN